jgi:hypothetical protein
MKKIQKSLLVLLAVAAVLPACKKGAEDPGMPFSSRKKRVEGEWKLVSSETAYSTETTDIDCDGNGATGKTTVSGTETFDATTYNNSGTWNNVCAGTTTSGTSKITGTVTAYTITFDKTGTWSAVMDYTTVETRDNLAGQAVPAGNVDKNEITIKKTTKSSGVWNFLGKIQDDTKNKEEISVSTTKSDVTTETTDIHTTTTTNGAGALVTTVSTDKRSDNAVDAYNNNEMVSIWKLVRLAKKEMKVIRDNKDVNSTTNSHTPQGGPTTGTVGSMTTTSTTTMTWNQ